MVSVTVEGEEQVRGIQSRKGLKPDMLVAIGGIMKMDPEFYMPIRTTSSVDMKLEASPKPRCSTYMVDQMNSVTAYRQQENMRFLYGYHMARRRTQCTKHFA